MRVGANYQGNSTCGFTVWAPKLSEVKLMLTKENEKLTMTNNGHGYWTLRVNGVKPGTNYMYELDGEVIKPDPASHFQPNGVFGSSEVINHEAFTWLDSDWIGLDIEELIFYEIHVGTFTPEGTFKASITRIKELSESGVNAIELMPISQFSGSRNWGYDGVFPYAVQNTYGTPNDLKEFVSECHKNGVALFIDLVYNHIGPEGNCLNDYAPYFSATRMGRWGPRINLDGACSDSVRNFFLENTLYWLSRYHIDGVRFDAVLAMPDTSPTNFFQELTNAVQENASKSGKKLHLIAELGGYNEPKILAPIEKGGFGFDAQWLEDYHHALFTLLTGEREGYYRNYGSMQDMIEALSDAYLYVGIDGGELSFRRRAPDESYRGIAANKFIVFSQNHDQIGNRLLGDRLTSIAGFEAAKLSAGMVLLSPYVPLLFMGEEFGETASFMFFTDYQSSELKEAVKMGRKKEFAQFHWEGRVPDPQSIITFEQSRINWQLRYLDIGKKIGDYYRALIKLRKNLQLFHSKANRQIQFLKEESGKLLFIEKRNQDSEAITIANFDKKSKGFTFPFKGFFRKILDSSEAAWGGQGSNLPKAAEHGENLEVKGFGFSVFLKSNEEVKNHE